MAEATPLIATTVYKCEECDTVSEEAGPALYECNDCGNIFNRDMGEGQGHQCPQCHKFASKIADQSCNDCQAGAVNETKAIQCSCHDEWHEI